MNVDTCYRNIHANVYDEHQYAKPASNKLLPFTKVWFYTAQEFFMTFSKVKFE